MRAASMLLNLSLAPRLYMEIGEGGRERESFCHKPKTHRPHHYSGGSSFYFYFLAIIPKQKQKQQQRQRQETMKSHVAAAVPIPVLAAFLLVALSQAQDFDFFYLVQQWPGSYCDTQKSCCYPTSGKPAADFGIHGLWPNYNDGSYPSNCDPDSPFDPSQITELMSGMRKEWPSLACPSSNGLAFWEHEWEKHGTCSESVLDQHAYFQAALRLKDQINLLQLLRAAGIQPDGGFYSIANITAAIRQATGFTPGIECNTDEDGKSQLYQIYLCVDTSGSNIIGCPVLPSNKCSSNQIEFPAF